MRVDLALFTASHFFYKVVGYGVLMMLTRHLDPERMGEFFFVASLASLTALVAELGTNSHLTRSLAAGKEQSADTFSEVFSFQLVLSLVLFSLLNALVGLTRPSLAPALAVTTLYVFLEQLYFVFGAAFVGLRRVSYNVACGVLAKLLLIALVAVAVLQDLSLYGILWCYVAANVVLLAAAYLLSRRVLRGIRLVWAPHRLRRMMGASLTFFGIALCNLVHFSADTLMLGYMQSLTAVAIYETAFKLFEAARFLSRAIFTIYFPVLSALVAKGKWDELRQQWLRLLGQASVAGMAASIGVGLLAWWIVPFVFGSGYGDSVAVLRVLYVCLPLFYLSQVGSLVANAAGLERHNMRITLVAVALNIVLNLYAIPNYGPIGAAWATVASHLFLAAWLNWFAFRRLGERQRPIRLGAE